MQKEEFQKILEGAGSGIDVTKLKSPKRGRTVMLGTFSTQEDEHTTTTLIHHVYIEDEHIHSLVYATGHEEPLHYDSGPIIQPVSLLFKSMRFRYIPELCDFQFATEMLMRVPSGVITFRRWREVKPTKKGPFYARRMHELRIPLA